MVVYNTHTILTIIILCLTWARRTTDSTRGLIISYTNKTHNIKIVIYRCNTQVCEYITYIKRKKGNIQTLCAPLPTDRGAKLFHYYGSRHYDDYY